MCYPDIKRLEDNQLEPGAEILRALAHPIRLQMVQLLLEGEKTVTEIHSTLGIKQSSASQQLSLMKTRGVLKSRRSGNRTHYSLARPGIGQLISCLHACASQ